VEGWRPVEDIVRWGFGQAPVVMANEFHSGWAHGPSGCDDDEWVPMGWHFRELSGIDPFVIVSTDNELTGEEPAEDGA
jgi:hypothetical protein